MDYNLSKISEENNRLAKLAQNGDKEALEKLIKNSERLIYKQVHRYKNCAVEEDDLYQDGVIGLLMALRNYDEKQGSFSTHAYSWIKAIMLKSIREKDGFHYCGSFYSKYIRYKKLKAATGLETDNFTDAELADYSLTRKDISDIQKYARTSCSLESITYGDDDNDPMNNVIPNFEDSIETQVYIKEIQSLVSKEMKRILSEKELFVIRHFYGIGTYEPERLTKISKMLSDEFHEGPHSKQCVQQIKTRAEQKLKRSRILRSLLL